ncbi:MAG: von Willebrand factor type A domain-containing protein, partial [Spartobacteria bacterium]
MNISLDDPKLTAYALDELSGAEKTEMERAIAASPEAQEFVREVRLLSGNLRVEYEAEREVHPVSHTNIVPLEQEDAPWSISHRLALAATIALCATLGAVAIGTVKHGGLAGSRKMAFLSNEPRVNLPPKEADRPVEGVEQAPVVDALALNEEPPGPPPPATTMAIGKTAAGTSAHLYAARQRPSSQPISSAPVEMKLEDFRRDAKKEDFNTARYGNIEENPFLAVASNPLSTFSIDVDTASYSNIRRFLENGSLPPKDAVRVE